MIRLILLIILLLLSFMTFVRAPTNFLWLTAIAVAEYFWIFVLIAVTLLAWGLMDVPYKTIGNVIGIISILFLISPVIRAAIISGKLKEELSVSLNTESTEIPERAPFSFFKLFTRNKKVNYQTYTYQKASDKEYKLDFYPARSQGLRPCIIIIHGGSWSSGDSQQLPELNSYLSEFGYNVASINYHFAPQFTSPRPVEDVKNAIDYLNKNAEKFNIDTSNIVLVGRSAGAQIALMAAYTLNNGNIKGVVDLYGPADMVWGYSIPANILVMDSKKVMEEYLGGKYESVPQNYVESSAVNFVDENSTPTLIIHGKLDVLVAYEHSTRLEKELIKSKVKYYWLKLPWASHGFDYNLRGPGGQLSTFAIETFINNVTHK